MEENLVFCRIVFKGKVQGVGFRFTTQRLAEKYNLCGFVRNMFSGDVEVEIEGGQSVIENFLKELTQRMKFYVTDSEILWDKGRGKFGKFEIKM